MYPNIICKKNPPKTENWDTLRHEKKQLIINSIFYDGLFQIKHLETKQLQMWITLLQSKMVVFNIFFKII